MNRAFPPRLLAVLCVGFSLSPLSGAGEAASANSSPQPKTAPSQALALDQAIERVLARNPRLKSGAAAIEAAGGRERQAAVRPNPELEVEVEDVALTGDGDPFGSSIYSVRASQTLELSGKRAKRMQVASCETAITRWELAALRVELVAETQNRFGDVLIAEARLEAAGAALEVARDVHKTVAERVRSGKVSPVAQTKSKVELAGRLLELRRAEGALAMAKASLAALWDADPEEAARLQLAGDLQRLPVLPELPELGRLLPANPAWAQGETMQERAEATVALERAAASPDVTLSAAIGREGGSGEGFVEFAVSIPLPLFNRNTGNIEAALAEAEQVRYEQQAMRLALKTTLARQWQETKMALTEAKTIRDTMLPAAETAFQSAEEAYRSGKLEYLDVLDAQQTLAEVRMQHIEALAEARRSLIGLERLIGKPVTNN
jgi:cobalt-zinc-cadmium efflux system outer membrane protein